ncbi:MAG: DUF4416 family protein [Candidatus Omnitrophica bacterium]|nr:DUF4416 family protein [Candidatus Omnitrophota bacterium]MBU4589472.1 DUF4416 family protein [Candidatus Omnitrophota bacterium]
MGTAKKPRQVKLIIGMLAKDKKLFDQIEEFFAKEFGEIDYRSPVLKFDHTHYYKKEMGHPLKRKFVSFKKLVSPEHISKIKLRTNSFEEACAVKKRRRINIDPGYISDSKLILVTTKNYSHRIYLNKGIYAEVTLSWKKGGFQPLEWTYPDYKTTEYRDILNSIRNSYMKQLQEG